MMCRLTADADYLVGNAELRDVSVKNAIDITIVGTRQAAVAGDQNRENTFEMTMPVEWVAQNFGGTAETRKQLMRRLIVRPGRNRILLVPPQLAGSDKLHRLGDLAGAANTADSTLNVLQGCHEIALLLHLIGSGDFFGSFDDNFNRLIVRLGTTIELIDNLGMSLFHGREQTMEGRVNFFTHQLVKGTADRGLQANNLLRYAQWLVLLLLQNLGQQAATSQALLGLSVEVARELGKRGQLTELSQLKAQAAGNTLCRLGLSRAADARNRQTNRDRRTNPLVKKIRFKVDLAIGNRDDVSRNLSTHIPCLGLDDWQCRQATGAELIG